MSQTGMTPEQHEKVKEIISALAILCDGMAAPDFAMAVSVEANKRGLKMCSMNDLNCIENFLISLQQQNTNLNMAKAALDSMRYGGVYYLGR